MMKMKNQKFLGLNPANLNVTNKLQEVVSLFAQSTECDKCIQLPLKKIHPGDSVNVQMNTDFSTIFSIRTKANETLCTKQYKFREKYDYSLLVHKDKTDECLLKIEEEAASILLPLLWAFLAYILLILCWFSFKTLRRWFTGNDNERLIVKDLGSPEESTTAHHITSSFDSLSQSVNVNQRRRLKSLDAFRGFAIAIMIFVNYGGGKYWFFQHTDWNGLTIADFVFPWFMWIMGVSMVLSLHSKLRLGFSKKKILVKIVSRSLLLFLIGIIINCRKGYDFSTLRILGVLQRFAITYLLAGSVDVLFSRASDLVRGEQRPWLYALSDITTSWRQWLFALSLITIHTCLTFLLDVPGCGRGYLGPGGLHMSLDKKNYTNCTGGAAGYIDRIILGNSHIYQTPTCKPIYHTTIPYDPEGLLGILTTTFLVFLGLQAGKILLFHPTYKARIIRWIIWGVVTGSIGLILCLASKDNGWIPINKNLWSLSFVLVMSGTSFILLPIFYYTIDIKQIWSGAPFFHAGMNSILLYIGSEFASGVFPWSWNCPPDHGCYLASALWGSTLWVIISIFLYYKNFFLAI